METEWNYLENAILNTTVNSFIKGTQISTFHCNALEGSSAVTFIGLLRDSYKPIHMEYLAKYDAWIAQGGSQEGETLNLQQLLRLLSGSKIKKWDIAIQGIYPNDTPKYKALLPNRRKPFQTGKQSEKIAAVNSLGIAIGSDTSLATTKTDVDLTYNQLMDTLNSQQSNISQTSIFSQELEAARIKMAIAQYRNLGMFIYEYGDEPSKIAPYFDLKNIRHHNQVYYTGSLQPLQDYCLFKHTFAADDEVQITNPWTSPLHFYIAELKTNKIGELFYVAAPGTQRTVKISALGNVKDKFVKVYNPSNAVLGKWEFEIL